ncbi:MAG: hypothetical protein HYU64_17620 [Armatimonadetes bacterium]|nr:hypothetical protein [Armatimonadota bacterium]
MSTIGSALPSFTPSYRPVNSTLAQVAQDHPEGSSRETARVVADVAIGAGMLGLTGLTILSSGAPGGFAQTNVPAIAYANMGLGLVYTLDQGMEVSKESRGQVGSGYGLAAGITMLIGGIGQAMGAGPGFTVAASTVAAAFMVGKGIARLKA